MISEINDEKRGNGFLYFGYENMNLKEERSLYRKAQKIANAFAKENDVIDVELGSKYVAGRVTNRLALRLRVTEKKSPKLLRRDEIFPTKIEGFDTDVIESKFQLHAPRSVNPQTFVRPVLGGIQIQSGIYDTNTHWGTLGCIILVNGVPLGLTNYHVLFGGSTPTFVETNFVSRLHIFQNLTVTNGRIGTATRIFSQELDYATFAMDTIEDGYQAVNALTGMVNSYVHPRFGLPVVKSGATTGVSHGIIDARSCLSCSSWAIRPDPRYPPNGIPLSDSGDSGSVWFMNEPNSQVLRPVALHYGADSPTSAKATSFISILTSMRSRF